MSPQSPPGSMGLGAPRPPHHGWPGESLEEPDTLDDPDTLDGPDEDWPDEWPDDDQPAAPGMTPPGRAGAGGSPGRPRPLAVALVAVVALAAGVGVALAVTRGPAPAAATPAAGAPSLATPSFGAPSFETPGSSSGGGAVPGTGAGGTEQVFIGGTVLAVTGTSITIGGPDRSVTAVIAGSTRITGQVSGIRGVKVGDLVTAQITESGSRATVTAIQDPAEPPSAGSLP
ncbi:MAG TPA: hypothetical protein VMI33_14670 [Streptosporangiaceae bacterium]|nr:hypothetical protein [Streptosporangiaceae bacterium]